jgi:hypothetical protein
MKSSGPQQQAPRELTWSRNHHRTTTPIHGNGDDLNSSLLSDLSLSCRGSGGMEASQSLIALVCDSGTLRLSHETHSETDISLSLFVLVLTQR